jgi:hypothetical protein
MKAKFLAAALLISCMPVCEASELSATLFAESIDGAFFDVDENDPIYFGKIAPNARFDEGHGEAFKVGVSMGYLGFQSLTSKSKTTSDEVELRTYSIGIGIRANDEAAEVIGGYFDFSLGIGHSEVILNGGRADHNALVEMQGSLGIIVWRRLSLGAGARMQVLGYPGETAAFSISPYLAAGIWL